MLLDELLREPRRSRPCELRLGSLGSPEARAAYREELVGLPARARGRARQGRPRADRREPAARLRLQGRGHARGDGRGADDARAARRATTPSTSPTVRRLLDQAGIAYELDGTLVRGLDYYTRTVFEFECEQLGAQSEVGGGGRYDGLVEQLGRAADPGGGLGGRRRADPAGARREPETPAARRLRRRRRRSARARTRARHASFGTRACAPSSTSAGRSMKGQMRQADRLGAAHAVILDERRRGPASRHELRRAAGDRAGASGRGARPT